VRRISSQEDCLDRNNHQGWYGECFVQVLAAAAGYAVGKPHPDVFGVDFFISSTNEVGDDFPLLAVQVKSWSVPVVRDGCWHYSELTQTQFNALAGENRTVPRLLVLVVVPPAIASFTSADEHLLRLSHAAYWMSLRDRARISEPSRKRKVPLMIPQRNLLTVDSLIWLCERSAMPHAAASPTGAP
jgi:hypothetical protein